MVLKRSITSPIKTPTLPDRGLAHLIAELDENNQECLSGGNRNILGNFLVNTASSSENLGISSTSTEAKISFSPIPLWLFL